MAEVLLSSEKFIKEVSSISDNTAGKYILPSLREAQEISLKSILGENLLKKLKELVKDEEIGLNANAKYKELLGNCQYFLAYTTIVNVAHITSYKIGNFGVAKATDTNLQSASQDEIAKTQEYYQSKADAYCYQLQNYLLENRSHFPELTESHLYKIEGNLYSAATCGIWLGGARGKGIAPKCERRHRR